jgi:hypothetical protein
VNKEYYQAKADLYRDLFVKQVADNQIEEASKNLLRMVSALGQLEYLKIKEERASEANKVL